MGVGSISVLDCDDEKRSRSFGGQHSVFEEGFRTSEASGAEGNRVCEDIGLDQSGKFFCFQMETKASEWEQMLLNGRKYF